MVKKAVLLFVVLLPVIVQAQDSDYGELKYYEKRNPYDDVKQAIAKKDLRFMALMGYAMYVPGVRNFDEKYQKYGYKLIESAGDNIIDYEHGRLIGIANYYAQTYNRELREYINTQNSWDMAKSLPGYDRIAAKYHIEDVRTGDINMLPYSLHAMLVTQKPHCVSRAWWFDAIKNNKPGYDWNDFERISTEVSDAVCRQAWIAAWIKAGKERSAESQIFGTRPYTEDNMAMFAVAPWHDAGLTGEPYYEVNLREGSKWMGTLFIGKDKHNALITTYHKTQHSTPLQASHWLDSFDFSYHPKAKAIEYISVTQDGHWKKVTK